MLLRRAKRDLAQPQLNSTSSTLPPASLVCQVTSLLKMCTSDLARSIPFSHTTGGTDRKSRCRGRRLAA
ncbi:hypothetical protein M419DRAFT_123142 [Trichoderma reesei RUT C-30]|uniref:Uncharacterized protein n=1 Tax=Hypocrea jecorina (strain ATCC 56765 / BCRC 32924 / NRRL 11460 / Rut C-30) TaxID=1344414 RepID=A0A024SB82_HYPJR|nr:hypothetical protein M419DRAFT_123142 [Trichoderma reesei RUT C-30]